MNKHLQLVREFLQEFSFPMAENGSSRELNESEIVKRQTILMDEGYNVIKSIHQKDQIEILHGLVELAYYALGSIAMIGDDVVDMRIEWLHDGTDDSVVQLVSESINECHSGETYSYSELYHHCIIIAENLLGADFDKAFELVHNYDMSRVSHEAKGLSSTLDGKIDLASQPGLDLSSCLAS